ncbi:uncharacterized protein BDR25DRAFT_341504 [Lindgomyces ingoldianus]|uniref:Uncharacterized protein n=1 Tax=Lindgomyces ingoldianus TaxID=673940 RepID=A0ACB6R2P2_9PLEO|nr:uncharacterized protein BDR25DRAFT_341504 [Lindgomyces ingoldianus]KAF2473446.1 hypothetical protein BDR25DRAFT_341504 [Lindgomyces ingoldianus]
MNLSILRSTFQTIKPSAFRHPKALQNASAQTITKPPSSGGRIAPFSSTPKLEKRKKGGKNATDPRITQIRYHLFHPLTPRPLRFSRLRFLRHWTIHRAWLLYLRKTRRAQELELERQYMSMRAACEALRLLDESGNTVTAEEAGGKGAETGRLGPRGKEVGRLYRAAMVKRFGLGGGGDGRPEGVLRGVEGQGEGGKWGVPIEYARLQTDFPARDGWNYGWTR